MYNLNKTIMRKRFTLALLSLLLVPLAMMAQSVTVDPSTGNLVAALSESSAEVGFENGWSAMWRHNQLPLTFVTADDGTLTDGNEIKVPAGNIYNNSGQLVINGGVGADLYCVLSLPKGYRFKGYKIVLLNNLNTKTVSGMTYSYQLAYNDWTGESYYTNTVRDVKKIMYETGNNWDIDNPKATGSYVDEEGNPTTEIQMGGTANDNSDTREYVIERNSLDASDMGNQLYFRLNHINSNEDAFYAVTIKSFVVYFTAEGTFGAEAKPTSRDVLKSMVMSPFKTNKIDIGAVESREKNNQTFYAYTYSNVKDLSAYTYIYQEDAVQDGVPMDVASTKKISSVTVDGNPYFAFGNGIYYVEAPTQVYSQTGLTYPIGFRVVGAKFTPQWGTATPGTSESRTEYYITYTSGGRTYYLNDQLRFTTTQFGWQYDSETKNIYTGTFGNYQFLSCEGSGDTRTLTLSSINGSWFNLIVFTRGGTTYIGWDNNTSSQRYYLIGNTTNTTPTVRRNYTYNRAGWSSGTGTISIPAYTPGAYTLNIYDKNKESIAQTVTINNASQAGTTIDLTDKATYGYNNDAIKFEITGLAEGQSALVDVSLFMQSLNPYIDQMNITCHDNAGQLSLSQSFTAENFMVSGQEFKFYIPTEYSNQELTFTFSDLYSQYGDNTYYTGALQKDGYARYSFVTSPYFEPIDQNGDNGLYDDAYNPNAPYKDKIHTTLAGNIRYKFNNAENLSNTSASTGQSFLQEYPFSAAVYVGSTDPDGGTETGAFKACTLNSTQTTGDTYYLFTADETRYNIAPSTAWQHRLYAFYRMGVTLETHTYDPKLTWDEVYDETCYNKDGQVGKEAMWGLKLSTVDHDTQEAVTGYLTVKEIDDAIKAALGKDGAPATADQIIYVDGSELYSILSSSDMTLDQLKAKFATNSLFYLPANTTSTSDNFAYKTTGTAFRAGRDIILEDNRPFYAPYDIQVDTDNKAEYKRKLSKDKYGKAQNASLIMPYVLKVEDGVHTNVDGSTFTVHTMKESDALKSEGDGLSAYAFFPELQEVSVTEANKPYFLKISENSSEDGVSFIVSQTGTLITASNKADVYTGSTSSGTINKGEAAGSYTLTPTGTYAGRQVVKTDNIFYFANNEFVNSADYTYDAPIKVSPFRAYYATEGTNAKSIVGTLSVVFGDGIGDEPNGIETIENGRNAIDINAPVYDLQGRKLADSIVGATLTKGIYVINGVKFTVK